MICIISLSLFIYACEKEPQPTMTMEKMSDILVDMRIADQVINLYDPLERDSMRQVLLESLHKVHTTTQAEIDANIYIYMSDFDDAHEMAELMMAKYDSLKTVYGDAFGKKE